MNLKLPFTVIFFFLIQNLFAQNDFESKFPTPIAQMSYEELKEVFLTYKENDTLTAKTYADAYIHKAKKNRDTLNIAYGYRLLLSTTKNNELSLKYVDSLIFITKNIKNKDYPAYGYLLKGYVLSKSGVYTEGLDYYLKAQYYALKQNNIPQQMIVKQSIGVVKNKWGAYEEALIIYKEHLNYIRQQENYKIKYQKKYFNAIYNLSLSYINNKKLDSATIYIKEGIKESLLAKDSLRYYRFLRVEGERLYKKKEYHKALDSLNKAIPHIKNASLAIGHIYEGKIYNELKNYKKVIFHLKKVDSIFQETNYLYSELPDAYHLLAQYYKNIDNKKEQLIYLEKFLYVDSLVKNNMIHFNKTINDKYDIPLLISEKEKIIRELENKETTSSKLILILFGIGLLFLFLTLLYFLKQRTYKKRLEILLSQKPDSNKDNDTTKTEKRNDLSELDKNIVDDVLKKIKEFEKHHRFLERNLSLHTLAKKFNTNSTYLSKIINTYKNKNFSNYINDLRINYVVTRLKKDKKFRLYSVKAIAYDIGFSNTQSFTNAFYKKTGIYPSYFIKQLKKQEI